MKLQAEQLLQNTMKQTSFFTHIYDPKKKKVRKEVFLGEMESVVP